MATHSGPLATIGCEPRQAWKGAAAAADSCAEVWLVWVATHWRGVRAAEGARLESVYGLTAHRGFESLPLRHHNSAKARIPCPSRHRPYFQVQNRDIPVFISLVAMTPRSVALPHVGSTRSVAAAVPSAPTRSRIHSTARSADFADVGGSVRYGARTVG
jgi:hypothetical protein